MMLAPLCMYCRQARVMWKIAEHIGAEGSLELLGVEIGGIVHLVLLGGVVHQDVDAAELLERCARPTPSRTSRRRRRPRTGSRWLPSSSTSRSVSSASSCSSRYRIAIMRALARHRDRDRAADAAVAAGDDRDLVLELADAGIFRHVFRPRPHLAFDARLMLLLLRRLLLRLRLFGSFFRLVMDVHGRASGSGRERFRRSRSSGA